MHQLRAILSIIFTILVQAALAPASLADGFDLPLERAKSGNLYVDAQLGNEMETRMLLDTGSGYVSLTAETFRRLKRDATESEMPVFSRRITGVMANGRSASVPVYRLAELTIGGCVLQDVEAVVFSRASENILGLSALRRVQPFTIDMDQGKLSGTACSTAAPLAPL
jgi:clan AA aspartic protease (TIGR02281 family)